MITRSLRFTGLLAATVQTKQRLLGATVVVLLVVSSCSSEQAASTTEAPAVTEESTTSAAPSSTEGTTTTTPPPAAEVTTTAAPSTTAAPEPIATTTTVPATVETDATEAALAAALEDFSSSWVRCAEQMPACDPQTLASASAGEQLEALVDVVLGANLNGWTVSNLDTFRTQMESVNFLDVTTAEVTACNEDGLVVAGRSGELVDDEFSSARTVRTFRLVDGAWKTTTARELLRVAGQENTLCEF